MSPAIPAATASLLALLLTANGLAQTVVGYGALTGAVSTAPGAAGKAAAERLSQVGSKINRSAATATAPRPGAAAASSPASADSAEAASEAASIVLRAQWGSADSAAAPDPGPALAGETVSTSAKMAAAVALEPRPRALRRGANIDDLIGEIGKPALVVQNISDVGYDRKYVFAGGASGRYSVLVLGAVIVDWEQQQ